MNESGSNVLPLTAETAAARVADANGAACLLLGNGIHHYTGSSVPSWRSLLLALGGKSGRANSSGWLDEADASALTYPEVFDLQVHSMVSGKVSRSTTAARFKTTIAKQAAAWASDDGRLARWVGGVSSGFNHVLTTNFDLLLQQADGAGVKANRELSTGGFSRYYPWHDFFPLKDGRSRIWHIHGYVTFPDSLRLGLHDYVGAVTQGRRWLQHDADSLHGRFRDLKAFFGKRTLGFPQWKGRGSWWEPFLQLPLFVVGLTLGDQETFLRWALIQRAALRRECELPADIYWLEVEKEQSEQGQAPARAQTGRSLVMALGGEVWRFDDYEPMYAALSKHDTQGADR